MIKSLHKVSKKLSKQLSGSLHVKGRKFKQLNRATEREHKLQKKRLQYAEQKNHELLIYLHIQEKINEDKNKVVFTPEDMREFISEYISRNDEELAQIEKDRRPGRPLSSKQQLQLEKRKHDEHVFETGFRIPDVSDKLTVERLRGWNGTSGSLSSWKYIMITKEGPKEDTDNMET